MALFFDKLPAAGPYGYEAPWDTLSQALYYVHPDKICQLNKPTQRIWLELADLWSTDSWDAVFEQIRDIADALEDFGGGDTGIAYRSPYVVWGGQHLCRIIDVGFLNVPRGFFSAETWKPMTLPAWRETLALEALDARMDRFKSM